MDYDFFAAMEFDSAVYEHSMAQLDKRNARKAARKEKRHYQEICANPNEHSGIYMKKSGAIRHGPRSTYGMKATLVPSRSAQHIMDKKAGDEAVLNLPTMLLEMREMEEMEEISKAVSTITPIDRNRMRIEATLNRMQIHIDGAGGAMKTVTMAICIEVYDIESNSVKCETVNLKIGDYSDVSESKIVADLEKAKGAIVNKLMDIVESDQLFQEVFHRLPEIHDVKVTITNIMATNGLYL